MRSRLVIGLAVAIASFSSMADAQDRSTQADRFADGLVPGDYLRVSGGVMSPVNPQGSLKDWDRGTVFSASWENWQPASSGVGRVGFGVGLTYGLLPLNEPQFLSEFLTPENSAATSATASKASVIEIETNLRVRIPSPFIMPSLTLGFGYINFRPGTIRYQSPSGPGRATEHTRNGAELSIGGGLDKQIIDRFGVFAEALYTYGFTSLGRYGGASAGICASNGCDPLKNTTLGTIRGGLRVRMGW